MAKRRLSKKRIHARWLFSVCFYLLLFASPLFVSATSWEDVSSKQSCPKGKPKRVTGCTTILVGRQATADGSVMMAHNEDMGTLSGRLIWQQSRRPSQEEVEVNYVTLPQVEQTYGYWASGNSRSVADSLYDGGWILCGMNTSGVSLGCNTMQTREEPIPRGKGILRYSIRQLVLERSRTALDAAHLVGRLIDAFGQSGSAVAYCIADRDEAWLVETTNRQWVARRIPDDGFHVVANQYTIETEWDMASEDLVAYAISQGWYDPSGGPFSFKVVYGDPDRMDRPVNTLREHQGRRMLQEKIGTITVRDLLSVLSSPPIQNTGTQAFMIWHLRKNMPHEIGLLMWHGMCGANTSVAVPVWASSTGVPEQYTDAPYEEDFESAWWSFERLQKRLYPRTDTYTESFDDARKALDAFQESVYRETSDVESKALGLWKRGDIEKIKDLLSHFTYDKLEDALEVARKVYSSLE
jgi:dipeptidase